MIILHCTQKVLTEGGFEESNLHAFPERGPVEHWYTNLFLCSRKKHLIFTHARSRFSFVVSNIRRHNVRHIGQTFAKALPKAMFYKEFRAEDIKEVSAWFNAISLAKTENHAVVGSMNEFTRHFKWYMEEELVGGEADIIAINKKLNEMPMRVFKRYEIPIQKFRKVVQEKY